jgi:nucleotide-binding universal stress UspA family protein
MYKHILVPTDGSKLSLAAAKTAAGLAKKVGARITSVYVMAPYMPPIESDVAAFYPAYSAKGYDREVRKSADKALARVKALADASQVKCEGVAVTGPNPWSDIIHTAKDKKCDLIVMASHGRRGLEALLLGSETQKVLTHSKVPVLVCR